jgi:hypothetical protein
MNASVTGQATDGRGAALQETTRTPDRPSFIRADGDRGKRTVTVVL